MTKWGSDYPGDRLALGPTSLRPGHVSPLTRAAYQNHERVEASAGRSRALSRCHSCLATVQGFRQNDMVTHSQRHLHKHSASKKYKNIVKKLFYFVSH